MNDFSVLAVDLDDTLLRADKSLSPETESLLASWEGQGRRIVIATGRPPRMTQAIPRRLHRFPWVCYNGAWAAMDGRVIYENLIAPDATRYFLSRFRGRYPHVWLGLEIDDQLVVDQDFDPSKQYVIGDLWAAAERPTAKILLRLSQLPDGLEPIFADLPAHCRALVSDKYDLVQIMPESADKAEAIAHLLERWGEDWDRVMAFGDDVNDVGMVARSRLGVAMLNAVAEVKAVADRITATNEEDGVAAVLAEYV